MSGLLLQYEATFTEEGCGALDIVLLLGTLATTIATFNAVDVRAAVLLVPYFIWVAFATWLNFSFCELNPKVQRCSRRSDADISLRLLPCQQPASSSQQHACASGTAHGEVHELVAMFLYGMSGQSDVHADCAGFPQHR